MVTITLKMANGDIHQITVEKEKKSRILVGLWTDKFVLFSEEGKPTRFVNPDQISDIRVVEE